MGKEKSYCWLNPELKRALKMSALERDVKLLDLRPFDLGLSEVQRKGNKRDDKRFNFRI